MWQLVAKKHKFKTCSKDPHTKLVNYKEGTTVKKPGGSSRRFMILQTTATSLAGKKTQFLFR